MVDTLMQNFVSLLDGGLEEADAQLAVVQVDPAPPLMSDPLGVPKWVNPGATNFCGKVRSTGDQYMALVQLCDAQEAVVEAIANTGGLRCWWI